MTHSVRFPVQTLSALHGAPNADDLSARRVLIHRRSATIEARIGLAASEERALTIFVVADVVQPSQIGALGLLEQLTHPLVLDTANAFVCLRLFRDGGGSEAAVGGLVC